MKNILLILSISLILFSCLSNPKQKSETLKYHILSKQDNSFTNTPIMAYKIMLDVDSLPTDEEMQNTATYIWKNGNQDWNEFSVSMYLTNMNPEAIAYGIGNFNSDGILSFFKYKSALLGTKWEIKKIQPTACNDNPKSISKESDSRFTAKKESILNYTILKDEVYDEPIKTQVVLNVLITDTAIPKQKVRELLTSLYGKTITRTGFKYSTNPTNVFIYAFTTREKANSGIQWIGMVSKSYSDTQPNITISDTQINSLTLKPVEKFGLSEKIRLEIWNKSIKLEDNAQKEADLKYPTDNFNVTIAEMGKNRDLYYKLRDKYRNGLTVKYGIRMAIVDSIDNEGFKKGWALPPQ